jgi:DNA-binding transcriptional MerR regulator
VSERALRYYQELGLITPTSRTPGGLRRYSQADLDRVAHIRELQALLGLNLDEVRVVLANKDRAAAVREEYHAEATDAQRRRELLFEGLSLRTELRATVEAKRDALQRFLDDLDAETGRLMALIEEGSLTPEGALITGGAGDQLAS